MPPGLLAPMGTNPQALLRRTVSLINQGVQPHMLMLYCKAKALWASRDRGATGVEYALLLVAVTAAIAGAVWTMRGIITGWFTTINDAITP